MRADFFMYREGKSFKRWEDGGEPETCYTLDVPEVTPEEVEEEGAAEVVSRLLGMAWEGGMPKGSQRTGCFQIQTDVGIFSSTTRGRFNPAKPDTIVFKTWEQVEAEEAGV